MGIKRLTFGMLLATGMLCANVSASVVIDMPPPVKAAAVEDESTTSGAGAASEEEAEAVETIDVGTIALTRYASYEYRQRPRNQYSSDMRAWSNYRVYYGGVAYRGPGPRFIWNIWPYYFPYRWCHPWFGYGPIISFGSGIDLDDVEEFD